MASPPELTVILPTFNEARNVPLMVERIGAALGEMPHEIIVVDDDSPDGTIGVARHLAAEHPHVRAIRRLGRRGLSGACVEGMMAASAPVIVVMDADGQHDETILRDMLAKIRDGDDVVVGSRYTGHGSASSGFTSTRARGSLTATRLALMLLKHPVTDPMSGFFMLRRELADEMAPLVSREGFKILFDILSRLGPEARVSEVPFSFREREHGESKLDLVVVMQFLGLLVSRLSGGILPVQFLLFALVGFSGIFVHLTVLYVLADVVAVPFVWSQLAATITAMTSNFVLNNELTFAHKKLRGRRFFIGLLTFYAVCSLGAVANISVAVWIYDFNPSAMLAGLAGALMSSVFNYAVTKLVTWKDT